MRDGDVFEPLEIASSLTVTKTDSGCRTPTFEDEMPSEGQVANPMIFDFDSPISDEDTEQWGSKKAAKADALLPAGNSKEKNGDQEVNTLNTDDDESSGLGTFAVSLIVCTGLLLLILLLCRANGDGPLAADRCECHPGAGFFQRYHFVSRCSKTGCSCLA